MLRRSSLNLLKISKRNFNMPKRSLFSGVSQSTRRSAGKMFLTSLSVSTVYCFSEELKQQFKSVSDELSLPSNRVAFSAEQELKRMFACDIKDLQPGQMKEIQTGQMKKKIQWWLQM